jgi:hypothetical protein
MKENGDYPWGFIVKKPLSEEAGNMKPEWFLSAGLLTSLLMGFSVI